jgi:hypothetical protein
VGLERGPLSLVRIIEELLELKISGSGLENKINCRGGSCADHATPPPPTLKQRSLFRLFVVLFSAVLKRMKWFLKCRLSVCLSVYTSMSSHAARWHLKDWKNFYSY